jgi:hypothetical protein
MATRRLALAAVVGLFCAHSSLSFNAPHRPVLIGARTSGAACAVQKCIGVAETRRSDHAVNARMPFWGLRRKPAPPAALLRPACSQQGRRLILSMTAAGPAAVQDADEQEQGPIMTAAQIAEEEARECVTEVVEVMMQESVATMAPAPYGSLPPRLWLDNVDALLNEPVYKSVMYQRLESCSSEQELVLLEVVDEKLLQFKKEQRDNRNKAKLEYIIGAALEGPQSLDETLLDLCETRGLDDGLVDYLDEIVDKARTAEAEKTSAGNKESQLVRMLTVVKDRVVAEIRTRDKPHVRMLAVCTRACVRACVPSAHLNVRMSAATLTSRALCPVLACAPLSIRCVAFPYLVRMYTPTTGAAAHG